MAYLRNNQWRTLLFRLVWLREQGCILSGKQHLAYICENRGILHRSNKKDKSSFSGPTFLFELNHHTDPVLYRMWWYGLRKGPIIYYFLLLIHVIMYQYFNLLRLLDITIWGRSQITLTTFWPLTTYLPPVDKVKDVLSYFKGEICTQIRDM